MNFPLAACVSCCGTFLLVSCGTSLKIDEYKPAVIDLPSHATVVIKADSNFGKEIREKLEAELQKDHGYDFFDGSYRRVDAVLYLRDGEVTSFNNSGYHTDDEGRQEWVSEYSASGKVTCLLVDPVTGTLFAEKKYSGSSTSQSEAAAEGYIAWDIATRMLRDMTPGRDTYRVRISSVETNPMVERAAKACKAGDWKLGREWAQQAARHDPCDAEARFLMGVIERRNLNFDGAKKHFTKALSLGEKGKYREQLDRCDRDKANMALYRRQVSGGKRLLVRKGVGSMGKNM